MKNTEQSGTHPRVTVAIVEETGQVQMVVHAEFEQP